MPKISEAQGPSFEEGQEPTEENGVAYVPEAVREAMQRPGEHGNYNFKNVGGVKSERGAYIGDNPDEDGEGCLGNKSSTSGDSTEETASENNDNDQSTAPSAGGRSNKQAAATDTAGSTAGKKALKRK